VQTSTDLYTLFNEIYVSFFNRYVPARAFVGSGSGPLLREARCDVYGIAVSRTRSSCHTFRDARVLENVAVTAPNIDDQMQTSHVKQGRRALSKKRLPPLTKPRQLDLASLGRRVREERERRGLTLEALSARARVSRSMLSAIERGAKAPTVLVLDRVATGLDTSLARLLGNERRETLILLRHHDQKVARDPNGWERRILSPVLPGVEFEFMRTTLGPHVDAGVFLPHAHGSREYVAIESGTLVLTINNTAYTLKAGDSIYYDGDCMHAFANPGDVPCVYYLAMDVSGDSAGREHRRAADGLR
jgi:transcriptional regulator with XRE-family HTH domain